ncbi:EboA domain-containing protein [Flavobacterium sp. Fl-77]|uniref:EboA domain-containing protein n=1 Tax=Flavobacterium flavipigmentatum TaxID=2893884 RepID=A0AAJ2S8S4_9FLAO|nr:MULTISPECIES: EboA domain-containing protein [unclassified Flavobacterium]MDX6183409.1 EboA domain-containing protein [Flavobacterium sp. Fl-33]MDX6186693.1 EboA domain-containing protein [Flavobacterium sp. Fl-77]UFH38539.1 EboA domain-containing protein [Flavobacterium sp. F-70]
MIAKSSKTAEEIIQNLLQKKLSESELEWFTATIKFENSTYFFKTFGLISRNISPVFPQWTTEEKALLEDLYPGFTESNWDLQQLCRCLLMIQLPKHQNIEILKNLAEMAAITELVCLYKGLFFLENAKDFVPMAQEGIRTNMVAVFDAIALGNPFAAKYLPIDAWNQLVLKAVFMGRPLYQITDLDSRKNEKLALIVHDYIHERWSAGRAVTPEIWRLVVGFVNTEIAQDLVSAVHNGDDLTKRAAFKTIKKSSFYHENEMPNEALFYKNISWNAIGAKYYSQLNS